MFQKKETILYTLKRYKNSKYIRLKIRFDGEVVVTAPPQTKKEYIDAFVQSKSNWIEEKIAVFSKLPQPNIKTQKGDYQKYKEQARSFVLEKIKKVNTHYNFSFGRVAIRNQKTRWGSCSNKKNLNFNYKIVFLPEKIAEYIVIHELCHLREMNHGIKFWKLVEQTTPDYRKIQKQLQNIKIK